MNLEPYFCFSGHGILSCKDPICLAAMLMVFGTILYRHRSFRGLIIIVFCRASNIIQTLPGELAKSVSHYLAAWKHRLATSVITWQTGNIIQHYLEDWQHHSGITCRTGNIQTLPGGLATSFNITWRTGNIIQHYLEDWQHHSDITCRTGDIIQTLPVGLGTSFNITWRTGEHHSDITWRTGDTIQHYLEDWQHHSGITCRTGNIQTLPGGLATSFNITWRTGNIIQHYLED